jgi:hypothetical protein
MQQGKRSSGGSRQTPFFYRYSRARSISLDSIYLGTLLFCRAIQKPTGIWTGRGMNMQDITYAQDYGISGKPSLSGMLVITNDATLYRNMWQGMS